MSIKSSIDLANKITKYFGKILTYEAIYVGNKSKQVIYDNSSLNK